MTARTVTKIVTAQETSDGAGVKLLRYGPFVMNDEAGIRQAISDYQTGRLAR